MVGKHHITVKELIEAGRLNAPVDIFGIYNGKRVDGRILRNGSIQVAGVEYSSPSVAAGVGITKATGRTTPGRNYFSVNGWKFWRVPHGKSNTPRSLDHFRPVL